MVTAVGWGLLGLLGASAVIVGIRRHRPARPGPWLLLGAALLALAVGDVCFEFGAVTAADTAYFAMFPLIALCLLQLTRRGGVLADRARLIDVLALTCAALLVAWVFVVGSPDHTGSTMGADVLGDVVLVGVAGRLLAAAMGNRAATLIFVGAVCLLISDVAYPLAPGRLAELGYAGVYLSWGAAALHPSMTELTTATAPRPTPWQTRWAALLGVSLATPPVILLYEAMSGGVTHGLAIATASGITLLLAITRLTDSLDQHRQALTRERGLRESGAAMVAAADIVQVDAAVRTTVRHLVPRAALHDVVFATDEPELPPHPTGATEATSRPRSWWLDAGRAGGATGAPATLVCPLWLEPLAVARPSGGALIVVGRHDALAATRDALEVLAAQAALAVDRILLVEAVGRRDSDRYLRAVIRKTSDIMLVTDDDQRIRYASPALTALLGTEPAPLSALQDFVHPDDRQRVHAALLGAGGDGSVLCALQRADNTQVLVEVNYRDLRQDRLVQGFVVTLRDLTDCQAPQPPRRDHLDNMPSRVNRRSASGKFRY